MLVRPRAWVVTAACFCLVGCGGGGAGGSGGSGDAGGDGGAVWALEIAPPSAELVVENGSPAMQSFAAFARFADGSTRDVTAETAFSLAEPRLGAFQGATLTANGLAAGASTVRAVWRDALGEAPVTIRVRRARVDSMSGAPANAPDLFAGATETPARAPSVVYPVDRTIVPPNLGDFEVHWADAAGNDLFEVSMVSRFVEQRLYVRRDPAQPATLWASYLPEEWRVAGDANRGGAIKVAVRGMKSADPSAAGTSAPIAIRVTDQDIAGGIYYWATSGVDPGIFRHDFGKPGEPAEAFYTQSIAGKCPACHTISRDGRKMAVSYNPGATAGSLVDVASRTQMIPETQWSFSTFRPDGMRLITNETRTFVLRDGGGVALGTIPLPPGISAVSQPDWSPLGGMIVFVAHDGSGLDWTLTGGRLMLQEYDPAADAFGAATELYVPPPGENVFYPSFSPDGQWVIFNRAATGSSYNNPAAELWIVRTDKSIGPIRLATPDQPVHTNSWPRWAPFKQETTSDTGDRELLFWFTFSSMRPFGVRTTAGERPQIWMAPFFPARALAGKDPSAPAFRLPFQNLATNNHIAQWTETIVPID